jgi:tetrapyrrole methylase family protein/MazG family protein
LPCELALHSFDDVYDAEDDFAEVYGAIVDRVLELGRRPAGVIYAVPGSPSVGEATVSAIRARAPSTGIDVSLIAGLSFIEPTLALLGLDALPGLQVCDALELAALHHPPLNPDVPALVAQIYGRRQAAACKLTLMNQYPDDHEVVLASAAGSQAEHAARMPLYDLDRRDDLSHLTTLYIPPLVATGSLEGFQDTVARLRAPGGCPWDQEQTHASLRPNLVEEAFEVVAAIDADDPAALAEELGDLLLQVVLHAQIATEEGEFKMWQVLSGIDRKLKHRHPHVWGDVTVHGSAEVVARWEKLKQVEKGEDRSVLDGVPDALPALLQAEVHGRRAARMGFDWPDAAGVIAKVREEIKELETAGSDAERESEMGDLLLAVVNWARWLDVDAESALRTANGRFARRFRAVEMAARQRGWDPAARSIEELEELWQAAKDDENQN